LPANELGPKGAIVVLLHPGWVQTAMGGPNAAMTPKDSVSSMRRDRSPDARRQRTLHQFQWHADSLVRNSQEQEKPAISMQIDACVP